MITEWRHIQWGHDTWESVGLRSGLWKRNVTAEKMQQRGMYQRGFHCLTLISLVCLIHIGDTQRSHYQVRFKATSSKLWFWSKNKRFGLVAWFISRVTAVANLLNQSVAQEQNICIRWRLFHVAMAVQADVNGINRKPWLKLFCGEMWRLKGCTCRCEHQSPWVAPRSPFGVSRATSVNRQCESALPVFCDFLVFMLT